MTGHLIELDEAHRLPVRGSELAGVPLTGGPPERSPELAFSGELVMNGHLVEPQRGRPSGSLRGRPMPEPESTFAEVVGEVERYCVISGRPVHMIPGDRCLSHGNTPVPCATDVRPAQCTHPKLSPNHPYLCCSECGKDLREVPGDSS